MAMNKAVQPRVSIITPSYNQGDFLEATIQSVVDQTYSNIEYIVIDGGSTDNSVDIIKKYSQFIHYWVTEDDKGQADAINKGFSRATGELLCWVNSDDILYPDFVSRRVKEFQENPEVYLIYGDVDQGESIAESEVRKGRITSIVNMLKYLECPVPQQSAMWRKEVVEKLGGLDTQWNVVLDREYFIRIAAHFPVLYKAGSVGFFRIHPAAKSSAQKIKWAIELPRLYERIFLENIYGLKPQLLGLQKSSLTKVYLKSANKFSKLGKKNDALSFYVKAKRLGFIRYFMRRYLKGLSKHF